MRLALLSLNFQCSRRSTLFIVRISRNPHPSHAASRNLSFFQPTQMQSEGTRKGLSRSPLFQKIYPPACRNDGPARFDHGIRQCVYSYTPLARPKPATIHAGARACILQGNGFHSVSYCTLLSRIVMFSRRDASLQSGFWGRHQDGDPAPPDAPRISTCLIVDRVVFQVLNDLACLMSYWNPGMRQCCPL